MVRRPAAVLGAPLLALAYFCAARELPSVGSGDGAVAVASAAGILAIVAVALCVAWARAPVGIVALALAGAALVAGALDAAGADVQASVPEGLAASAFGVLLGLALVRVAGPATALAVPLVVALVDVWSVVAGPSSRLAGGSPRGAAALTIDLPSWGGELAGSAARLGLTDAVFLAAFATWALRLGLRPCASALAMTIGLLATVSVSIAADRALPALPAIALGFLLANADRMVPLARAGLAR